MKKKRGPGQPKKVPTKVMRVPLPLVEKFKKLIKLFRKNARPVDLVLLIPAAVGILISLL